MPPSSGCVSIILLILFIVFGTVGLSSPVAEPAVIPGPTLIVILTATPVPGALQPAAYQATIDAQQMTISALEQPPIIITATPGGDSGVATSVPALLPAVPTDLPPAMPSATSHDDGCLRHIVEVGDTFIGIAQQYGVFPGDLLAANGIDENHLLQIGEILIIPVDGCDALNAQIAIPSNTPFVSTVPAPTVTLAPTATDSQIEIVAVQFPGDITAESVEISNLGSTISLQGWRLENQRGESFIFPDVRMFAGSHLTVFSRQGQSTPIALYWGRTTPAWMSGEVVLLLDAVGELQAVFQID